MRSFVHFIPIATTVLAALFAPVVFRRWQAKKPAPHLFWWALGIGLYGVGTFTESFTTLFGWNEAVFRSWYISGALLGGAPLAQGTVYLMFSRRTANRMAVVLGAFILVAATAVLLSPIDFSLVESQLVLPTHLGHVRIAERPPAPPGSLEARWKNLQTALSESLGEASGEHARPEHWQEATRQADRLVSLETQLYERLLANA